MTFTATLRCWYCDTGDGLTMLPDGREVCRPCYNKGVIGPCELGRKGWDPCTSCGRPATTYCRLCDIRICPACFTGHREQWKNPPPEGITL